MKISQERLKEIVVYNPDTGSLHWACNRKGVTGGQQAGGVNPRGYYSVMLDGVQYSLHRIAWLYVYGVVPPGQVDHINRNKLDNRIKNLRVVDSRTNTGNRIKPSNTGHLNVYKQNERYFSTVWSKGKAYRKPMRATLEEALEDKVCIYRELVHGTTDSP